MCCLRDCRQGLVRERVVAADCIGDNSGSILNLPFLPFAGNEVEVRGFRLAVDWVGDWRGIVVNLFPLELVPVGSMLLRLSVVWNEKVFVVCFPLVFELLVLIDLVETEVHCLNVIPAVCVAIGQTRLQRVWLSMPSTLTLSVRESLSVVFNVLLPPSLLLLPVLLVLLLSFVVPWVLLLETVFEMDVEIWNDSTLLLGRIGTVVEPFAVAAAGSLNRVD